MEETHKKVIAVGGVIGIANNCDVQDGTVMHTDMGSPLTLGKGVTVGHNAMLHGCTVGDYSLSVKRDGQADKEPVAVNVSLGGTTNVNLGGSDTGPVTLGSVQVSAQNLASNAAGIGREPLGLRVLLTSAIQSDPDVDVLKDVTLRIAPGETVAVVGAYWMSSIRLLRNTTWPGVTATSRPTTKFSAPAGGAPVSVRPMSWIAWVAPWTRLVPPLVSVRRSTISSSCRPTSVPATA